LHGRFPYFGKLFAQSNYCCSDTLQDAGVSGKCIYWILDISLQHSVRFIGSSTSQQLNTFCRHYGHLEVLSTGNLVW
jgi:hypothetical protein